MTASDGGTGTGSNSATGAGASAAGGLLDAATAWQRLLRLRTAEEAAGAGLLRGEDDGVWRWRQPADPEAETLASLYTPLCLGGSAFAFAQLGQSIDGFIATRTGHSNYVTGEEDRLHLHRLRALADAVLVGAGTTVADDPQLTVRACTGDHPVRVVLDPGGRAARQAPGARLFTDGRAPTLRLVGEGQGTDVTAPRGTEDVVELPRGEGGFEPRLVVETLARRGLGRILVEGGGATVSGFLRAETLHRLYVTVAPVLIGDGVPGLRFPGPVRMGEALWPRTRAFALGADMLFELDLLDSGTGTGD
ncbi:RibD family protein [Streptomyces sp. Amel2xB2]|uniref:RibD family protein n=1 Tax=Streptomyces sp. Amel2xB2 TaxID=1305829 RepID=UPI000DB97B51|nr:RibD family protein [Streptomyces sp. Amel2xB2]